MSIVHGDRQTVGLEVRASPQNGYNFSQRFDSVMALQVVQLPSKSHAVRCWETVVHQDAEAVAIAPANNAYAPESMKQGLPNRRRFSQAFLRNKFRMRTIDRSAANGFLVSERNRFSPSARAGHVGTTCRHGTSGREGRRIRPERHNPRSIATVRTIMARCLVRLLPQCPCCGLSHQQIFRFDVFFRSRSGTVFGFAPGFIVSMSPRPAIPQRVDLRQSSLPPSPDVVMVKPIVGNRQPLGEGRGIFSWRNGEFSGSPAILMMF
jgi:hypothetical protein